MSLVVEIEKKLKGMVLNVSFSAHETEIVTGILGASGCGKSMTLKCIAGIEKPDRGKIVLNNRVLFDSEKKINLKVQERGVGYLFQNYALFPHMTVGQNIELALKGSKAECHRQAEPYLNLLHIEELINEFPSRLSGGQQQRVALARILASKPAVLMLDEPFSALDAYLKEKLQLEILDVLKEYHGDILMVTHNRDEVYRFCSHIHVLDHGCLVRSGETKSVFAEPKAVAAARLTGCKNIVDIVRISDWEMQVPEWNMSLHFHTRIPKKTKAVGIRAHDLRAGNSDETVNRVPCHCIRLLEDPFEITLILENGIWWKIPKEVWKGEFHEIVPKELVLLEENVLFLQ